MMMKVSNKFSMKKIITRAALILIVVAALFVIRDIYMRNRFKGDYPSFGDDDERDAARTSGGGGGGFFRKSVADKSYLGGNVLAAEREEDNKKYHHHQPHIVNFFVWVTNTYNGTMDNLLAAGRHDNVHPILVDNTGCDLSEAIPHQLPPLLQSKPFVQRLGAAPSFDCIAWRKARNEMYSRVQGLEIRWPSFPLAPPALANYFSRLTRSVGRRYFIVVQPETVLTAPESITHVVTAAGHFLKSKSPFCVMLTKYYSMALYDSISAHRAIGDFDEGMYSGFEIDFFERCKAAGLPTAYVPRSASHVEMMEDRNHHNQPLDLILKEIFANSANYLEKKWMTQFNQSFEESLPRNVPRAVVSLEKGDHRPYIDICRALSAGVGMPVKGYSLLLEPIKKTTAASTLSTMEVAGTPHAAFRLAISKADLGQLAIYAGVKSIGFHDATPQKYPDAEEGCGWGKLTC